MTPEDIEFVKNLLRQGSVKWKGRAECLRRARKKVLERRNKKTGEPIYKFHWKCAECKQWYRDEKSMEVDHIKEIGSFKNWNSFVPAVFCSQKNLACLCLVCHMKKTKRFNSARSRWKRKSDK